MSLHVKLHNKILLDANFTTQLLITQAQKHSDVIVIIDQNHEENQNLLCNPRNSGCTNNLKCQFMVFSLITTQQQPVMIIRSAVHHLHRINLKIGCENYIIR